MSYASTSEDYKFKLQIVLLGEGAVGKSSIMLRYVQGNFSSRHVSTIQASFLTKQIELNGKVVELSIWDTAGQEQYHALGPLYYRGSQGALLIYDVTDEKSFDKVKLWVRELRRALGDDCVLYIVGNKIDLAENRALPPETAKEYAEEVQAGYEEISAKENIGVDELFQRIAQDMIKKAYNNRTASSRADGGSSSFEGRRIVVIDDRQPKRGKCC